MPKTGLTSEQIKVRAVDLTISRMRKFGFEKVRLSEIAKDLGVSHAALYSHFSDKAALFDAVSARWLKELDDKLEGICDHTDLEPRARITKWFLELHRAKCTKICNDPELFKAFNYSAQIEKPFVQSHLRNMDRQLQRLAGEAVKMGEMKGDTDVIAKMLFEATIAFHHPVLVALHINEDREPLLKRVLKTLFDGLK
ncbi:MAG: TetR family transcriptional regulator [Cyanobacteria bacterium SZAS TMP-1]|nr:TetR family transcriptional regulator [Cyanobacteria bacterium SZAS TMP-1]